MTRRIPALLSLALLCASGAGTVLAAVNPVEHLPSAANEQASTPGPQWNDDRGGRFGRRGHARDRSNDDPVRVAARQLRLLERLYRVNGRGSEIPALYQDVLAHTQNPMLRTFAYGRLARSELRPAHPEQAIESLRKSVDESLQRVH